MKQVWAYALNRIGPMPSRCWASAAACKRRVEDGRPEKIQWVELPSGTWAGQFINQDNRRKMQVFVYAIRIIKDE